MNGNKALLDSNVIIDASKGLISLNEIVEQYDNIYTSIICYIEVMGYNFDNEEEQAAIEKILQIIPIINLDKETADVAVNFRKKTKIKLPDALIVATAEKLSADLITSNISDFKNLTDKIKILEPKKIN